MDDSEIYQARIELVDFAIEVFHDVPSEEFVSNLLSGELQTPADEVNEYLDEGFDELRRFVDENEGRDLAEVLDELEAEFTRTFVGPRPPVLPHETYYRDDTEFIGEGLAEVQSSYSAAGWSSPDDYGEEDDYVAVELAFVRHLIEQQRAGREETFGFERVFLDEHLLTWVDDFVEDVLDETDEPLFRAGALVVSGFAEFEDELVAQMV